ncbi:hypothetical protein DPMN_108611 [Dreissena polymorpha]|uniref:Uncharacterized protein n=1 Tax=Dreissena polymorpha TaxID=45954 RepID=A0A9D4K949_DREPO|nr:hypothetical protein DPMN_108611 [Dreissena polymorpha]
MKLNEIVYARFVHEGIPKNAFVSIKAVEHTHPEAVLGAIESAIDTIDPGWDWKPKLITTGSDGASVNLEKRQSVAKMLRGQVPHFLPCTVLATDLDLVQYML